MQNYKKSDSENKKKILELDEQTLEIIEKTLDHFLNINGNIKEIFSSISECTVNFKKLIKDSGFLEFLKQKHKDKNSYEIKNETKRKVLN